MMQFLPFNKISANISEFYFFSVVLRKKTARLSVARCFLWAIPIYFSTGVILSL